MLKSTEKGPATKGRGFMKFPYVPIQFDCRNYIHMAVGDSQPPPGCSSASET